MSAAARIAEDLEAFGLSLARVHLVLQEAAIVYQNLHVIEARPEPLEFKVAAVVRSPLRGHALELRVEQLDRELVNVGRVVREVDHAADGARARLAFALALRARRAAQRGEQ